MQPEIMSLSSLPFFLLNFFYTLLVRARILCQMGKIELQFGEGKNLPSI